MTMENQYVYLKEIHLEMIVFFSIALLVFRELSVP